MAEEVINLLAPKENETFIDCTLGSGGHARAILERTAPKGMLLGIDWDPEAIKRAGAALKKEAQAKRIILVRGNYADIDEIAAKAGIREADGVFLDLGYSSDQLEAGRGFSFLSGDPLDMRYDPANPLKASHIVRYWNRRDIEKILKEYGEERLAPHIARAIIEARSQRPIETSKDLADIVEQAVGDRYRAQHIHPATRTFQALRIAVNHELDNLKMALPKAINILKKGGRVGVLSFHSLEDRIVKDTLRELAKQNIVELIAKKHHSPTFAEIATNPRARSAKLRTAKKQ